MFSSLNPLARKTSQVLKGTELPEQITINHYTISIDLWLLLLAIGMVLLWLKEKQKSK